MHRGRARRGNADRSLDVRGRAVAPRGLLSLASLTVISASAARLKVGLMALTAVCDDSRALGSIALVTGPFFQRTSTAAGRARARVTVKEKPAATSRPVATD